MPTTSDADRLLLAIARGVEMLLRDGNPIEVRRITPIDRQDAANALRDAMVVFTAPQVSADRPG